MPDFPDDSGIEILDIAVEPTLGDVYIAATCFAPCTFAPGIAIIPTPAGGSIAIAKYDSQGKFKWVNNLGYLGAEGQSIHISSASLDGVYIAASFSTPEIDFGNGVKVADNCTIYCEDVFLAKIAANGNAQWAKTISGGNNALINVSGVELDAAGILHLAGNYESTAVDFGGNFAYNALPGVGFFLAEYSISSGDPLKVHFAAPQSGAANAQHFALNQNGQMLLAGPFSDTLKFENGLSIVEPNDTTGYFVAGLAADGNAQWVRNLGSSDYFDVLGVDIDESGQGYLAIDASTDLILDTNTILYINSLYAGLVLKLGASSFSLPVLIEYNTYDYVIMDVELDPSGNIYTAGFTTEPVNFVGANVPVDGCVDGLITATSSEGLPQWARTVGQTGCEAFVNNQYSACLAFDGAGHLYATGLFTEGFEEDGIVLAGQGGFVAKFNTSIVGTAEPISIEELKISPNPNMGNFSITLKEFPSYSTQLIVHDLCGREVFRQEIFTLQTQIQTLLPAGAYVATVQNKQRLERQKLIVQR